MPRGQAPGHTSLHLRGEGGETSEIPFKDQPAPGTEQALQLKGTNIFVSTEIQFSHYKFTLLKCTTQCFSVLTDV